MKYILPITLLTLLTLTGCASITSESMQPVDVSAKSAQGKNLSEVDCTLRNEKGEWDVKAPNTVSVRKAAGNLIVKCKKAGHPDGKLSAISRAGAGMYGNLIFGGGVGALIDHNKGTAYNYPSKLPVVMGQKVVVDRRTSK